ncbi:MAG: hypothetical protein NTX06_09170, partial [Proteobacteria bacterium]|nr:hypothetical protein [Pseudomonadota bacterium]
LTSVFSRIFFTISALFLFIAALQKALFWMGVPVDKLQWVGYNPGRLFEFAGIFLLFVVVLLLRQIRELLKK